MDGINKFLGFQQSIISESADQKVQPEQTVSDVSSAGIVDAPDAFEAFEQPAVDLTSLTTPMTSPGSPEQSISVGPGPLLQDSVIPQELKIAESAPLFNDASDVLTPDILKDAPVAIDENVLDTGRVRWDAIESIKTEMAKKNRVGVMQILQELMPNELVATLTALTKQGTPSDLQLLVDQVCRDPDAMGMMGSLLCTLCEKFSSNPNVKLPLLQILSTLEKGNYMAPDWVIRDLFQQVRGNGILSTLDQDVLTPIYVILQSGSNSKIVNALCANAIYEESKIEADPNRICNISNPDYPNYLLDQLLKDPSLLSPMNDLKMVDFCEAIKLFPEWGLNAMNKVVSNGMLDHQFLGQMIFASNFGFGSLLAQFARQDNSERVLTEIIRVSLKNGYGDWFIRDMVEKLGSSAIKVLSKYSPLLLMDIKTILENGNDKEANQTVIKNVIEPAISAAINRTKWTDPGPTDMDPGKYLKL